MIQIEKTKYYNKEEIAARLHCTLPTINNKIVRSKVQGYYFGHKKHYTEEQIKILAEVRTIAPKAKKVAQD